LIAQAKDTYDSLSDKDKKRVSPECLNKLNELIELVHSGSVSLTTDGIAVLDVKVTGLGTVVSSDYIRNGTETNVILNVLNNGDFEVPMGDDLTADQYNKKKVKEKTDKDGKTIINDFIIDLTTVIDGVSKSIKNIQKDSEGMGKIRITIVLPENLRGHTNYSMEHIHNGQLITLVDLDNGPNTFTIETDRFSEFVLAYYDSPSLGQSEYIYNGVDYSAFYNYDYYISANSDVKNAFGNDKAACLAHFIYFGMAEGRQGSEGFNVWAYREYNPDLVNVFGNDLAKYYNHYNMFGKNEGRFAVVTDPNGGSGDDGYNVSDYAGVFDMAYYKANNADVVFAIGNDDVGIFKQFVEYGMAEGRLGCEGFNIWTYREYNPELISVFVNDLAKYYYHYIMYGKNEGRIASVSNSGNGSGDGDYNAADYAAVFDLAFYKTNNTDVATAFGNDDAGILKHFVEYGMSEGRQGSEEFNVWIYRVKNSDLVTAFGNDLAKYYNHFISYGQNEGRIAK
jgi:hypothetical protein